VDKIIGWLAKIIPFITNYPAAIRYVIVVTVALLFVSLFLCIVFYPLASKASANFTVDTQLPELIKQAQLYQRKYVIKSIFMDVRLDPNFFDQSGQTEANVRIIYDLFAIEDVTPADFGEFYHSNESNVIAVERLAGSEDDGSPTENGNAERSWNVNVDIAKGSWRTLTTAAKYRYHLPWPPLHTVHDFENLSALQNAFGYPNTGEKPDVIGSLMIMIESPFPLDAPTDRDAVVHFEDLSRKGTFLWTKPALRESLDGTTKSYAVIARWDNVISQIVAVKFTKALDK
jgi:hypothetical protein